jgi:hypothetical protein
MPLKPRDIESLLQRKFGFTPAQNRSVDHRSYQLTLPGLPPIVTKVSHNKRDIGPALQTKMARQLRVHGPFFREMLSCRKNSDEYRNQVQADPHPAFGDRI